MVWRLFVDYPYPVWGEVEIHYAGLCGGRSGRFAQRKSRVGILNGVMRIEKVVCRDSSGEER